MEQEEYLEDQRNRLEYTVDNIISLPDADDRMHDGFLAKLQKHLEECKAWMKPEASTGCTEFWMKFR